jgi:hypothetical protein
VNSSNIGVGGGLFQATGLNTSTYTTIGSNQPELRLTGNLDTGETAGVYSDHVTIREIARSDQVTFRHMQLTLSIAGGDDLL